MGDASSIEFRILRLFAGSTAATATASALGRGRGPRFAGLRQRGCPCFRSRFGLALGFSEFGGGRHSPVRLGAAVIIRRANDNGPGTIAEERHNTLAAFTHRALCRGGQSRCIQEDRIDTRVRWRWAVDAEPLGHHGERWNAWRRGGCGPSRIDGRHDFTIAASTRPTLPGAGSGTGRSHGSGGQGWRWSPPKFSSPLPSFSCPRS